MTLCHFVAAVPIGTRSHACYSSFVQALCCADLVVIRLYLTMVFEQLLLKTGKVVRELTVQKLAVKCQTHKAAHGST